MGRLLPLALLCVGAVAGCGGDDEEPTRRAVTVPAGRDLRVKADEYSFDPARVTVQDGGRRPLKIVLDNRGTLAHNLKVLRDGRELGGAPTFPGGEARSGTVSLPKGRYRIICTVGNHEELGMTGELEVR
jgi:plastocyanin